MRGHRKFCPLRESAPLSPGPQGCTSLGKVGRSMAAHHCPYRSGAPSGLCQQSGDGHSSWGSWLGGRWRWAHGGRGRCPDGGVSSSTGIWLGLPGIKSSVKQNPPGGAGLGGHQFLPERLQANPRTQGTASFPSCSHPVHTLSTRCPMPRGARNCPTEQRGLHSSL